MGSSDILIFIDIEPSYKDIGLFRKLVGSPSNTFSQVKVGSLVQEDCHVLFVSESVRDTQLLGFKYFFP